MEFENTDKEAAAAAAAAVQLETAKNVEKTSSLESDTACTRVSNKDALLDFLNSEKNSNGYPQEDDEKAASAVDYLSEFSVSGKPQEKTNGFTQHELSDTMEEASFLDFSIKNEPVADVPAPHKFETPASVPVEKIDEPKVVNDFSNDFAGSDVKSSNLEQFSVSDLPESDGFIFNDNAVEKIIPPPPAQELLPQSDNALNTGFFEDYDNKALPPPPYVEEDTPVEDEYAMSDNLIDIGEPQEKVEEFITESCAREFVPESCSREFALESCSREFVPKLALDEFLEKKPAAAGEPANFKAAEDEPIPEYVPVCPRSVAKKPSDESYEDDGALKIGPIGIISEYGLSELFIVVFWGQIRTCIRVFLIMYILAVVR